MLSLEVRTIGTVRDTRDGRFLVQLLPAYADGLHGLAPGDRVLVLYWMHDLAHQDRRSLRVHPGGRIEADARRLLLAQLYPAEPDRR